MASLIEGIKFRVLYATLPLAWHFEGLYSFFVNFKKVSLQHQASTEVEPGVMHHTYRLSRKGKVFDVNVIEVDLQRPHLRVESALALNRLKTRDHLANFMAEPQALAAINASFYNRETDMLIGLLVQHGTMLSPPLHNQVSLGITKNNRVKIDYLAFQGRCTNSKDITLPLDALNQEPVKTDAVALYTPHWSGPLPVRNGDNLTVFIQENRVVKISAGGVLEQPKETQALCGPRHKLEGFVSEGETLDITLATHPQWDDVTFAIGGGPLLVKKGQVRIEAKRQGLISKSLYYNAVRSAAGVTPNHHFLAVTISHPKRLCANPMPGGIRFHTLALVMKQLGCHTALNLDGGTSTQMMVRDKHLTFGTRCDKAKIPCALVIRSLKTPDQAEGV